MFKLHAIQAEFGDSLLLEFGTPANPKYILIDGGPDPVYLKYLRPELDRLVSTGKLEALVISHVDNDHILGILGILSELKRQQDAQEDAFIHIEELWLNTFSQTIDNDRNLQQRMDTLVTQAAAAGVQMHAAGFTVNGVGEGHKVTQQCTMLNIPVNARSANGFFMVDTDGAQIIFDNLRLTIVGPTKKNLEELQKEWEKWLKKNEQRLAAGKFNVLAMADKSIPNLSSIMFLAEANGRTMLFTGDGRGDHLLEGLEMKGLLEESGTIHVDIFKVPHHGSDRNVNRKMFETILADVYVISANGKHSNPDFATLTWILEANSAARRIRLVVTNETPSTKKLQEVYDPNEWNYTIEFIPEGSFSVEI